MMATRDLEALLKGLVAWAGAQEQIIALYLHGSHAQGGAGPLSDVDVALLARVEDIYGAAFIELAYKGVLYGWYGGTDRDYSSYVPNELLVWDILSWGVENGFRYTARPSSCIKP
jgi:predicted nucleotidyltransferase